MVRVVCKHLILLLAWFHVVISYIQIYCTHSNFPSLSVQSHIPHTYVVHTQISCLCQFIVMTHIRMLYTLKFSVFVSLQSYPTYVCCTHSNFLSLSVYSHDPHTYVVHTQIFCLCQFIVISYVLMLYTLKFPVFVSLQSYPTYLCCIHSNFLSLSDYCHILRIYVARLKFPLCQFIVISYVLTYLLKLLTSTVVFPDHSHIACVQVVSFSDIVHISKSSVSVTHHTPSYIFKCSVL